MYSQSPITKKSYEIPDEGAKDSIKKFLDHNAKNKVVVVQGLGFVGYAMALVVANAKTNYAVIGVDLPNEDSFWKVASINDGDLPLTSSDKKLVDYSKNAQRRGNFYATHDEYAYQVELITTAIQDCIRNDIGGKLLADLVKVTYRSPHKLDMKTIAEVGHPPKWLYENIDIALISGGEGTGYGYVDEKQLIPIYYKKPFITFGCKGIYKEMKKLGFDPYDNFWDISYDEENNFFERIYSCYMLVKKLDELSPDEFKELIDSTQDTVEYNFDHLVSGNFRDLSNNNFFKELLDASS